MANPIYKTPNSLFIDTSNDLVSLQTDSIGVAQTSVLSIINNTAGANNAPQYSSALEFITQGYNSGGSVSTSNKYAIQLQNVSGTYATTNRSGDGYLTFLSGYAGASYGSNTVLDSLGNISANGYVSHSGSASSLPTNPWIDVSYVNGWTNFGAPYHNMQYYKDAFGIVHFRGGIKGPGGAGSSTCFTIPAGYRPLTKYDIAVFNNTALTSFGLFNVFTNGVWTFANINPLILFDGLSYFAGQ